VLAVASLLKDSRIIPRNALLLDASYFGCKKIVELLLQDTRIDPSVGDNQALRCASSRGHKEIVEMLLQDKRVASGTQPSTKKRLRGLSKTTA
jgi:hypothetical protein